MIDRNVISTINLQQLHEIAHLKILFYTHNVLMSKVRTKITFNFSWDELLKIFHFWSLLNRPYAIATSSFVATLLNVIGKYTNISIMN
jgi:hypothetical protein